MTTPIYIAVLGVISFYGGGFSLAGMLIGWIWDNENVARISASALVLCLVGLGFALILDRAPS